MKHYTGNDLRKLYDEVPPELQDRVSRTLAGLPEQDRQNAGMSRKVWICLAAASVSTCSLRSASRRRYRLITFGKSLKFITNSSFRTKIEIKKGTSKRKRPCGIR